MITPLAIKGREIEESKGFFFLPLFLGEKEEELKQKRKETKAKKRGLVVERK